jgi:ABC-type Fe3+/spermidine/putrescine transport system ATPase subunit
MAEATVSIRNVSKSFGSVRVLNDISLEIPKGSFTTFLGPSGCGKTTLLRTIAGFYKADEGQMYIGGKLINEVPTHLRNAIMVFQDYALFPHMNVRENIGYGLRIKKLPLAEIAARIGKTAEYLDIKELLDRTPGQISGGQQQRVALARALVMEPELLLLDEPLSNLDAKLRVNIRAELRQLQKRLRITTIYVTHDQSEALAMSDMIAVIDGGRVVQYDRPSEIYYRPIDAFVASFVGTVNLLAGRVKSLSSDRLEVSVGRENVYVERKALAGEAAYEEGEEVTLCIRPETLRLVGEAPGSTGRENLFKGLVSNYIFEGGSVRFWIEAFGKEIIVDVFDPGERGIIEGEVSLSIDPSRIHLLAKGRVHS